MAERIRVGIIYQNNDNWIGGTYYIQNLIAALCTLPDVLKPALTILAQTEKDFEDIKKFGYPYLTYAPLHYLNQNQSILKRILNKTANFFTHYDLFPQPLKLNVEDLDFIFPAPVSLVTSDKNKNIYWIPDFQEQFLPQFFSEKEILNRNQLYRFIANTKDRLVFSSQDAFNTFSSLFPKSKIRKYILRFAVTHATSYKNLDINSLLVKYKIDKPYFFAPNQFWKHKNQIVILKAIKQLKERGIEDFIIAFSGKETDYRNPDYFDSLLDFVSANKLENNVRFLGFIDRNEQLKLMSKAIAIIQPSLFEGWSTVVEDAKAMNQWIIASELAVHLEQLEYNVSFFNPGKSEELANILANSLHKELNKMDFSYPDQIRAFALDFLKIIDSGSNNEN